MQGVEWRSIVIHSELHRSPLQFDPQGKTVA